MKTIVITGAAGGIGGAIVDKFLSNGVKVIGLDIQETVSTLSSNPNYQGFVVDVKSYEQLAEVAKKLNKVDYVVTSAGIALADESQVNGGLSLPSAKVFAESVELNLNTHYNALLAFLPNLQAAEGDRSVTFISSVNAIQGFGLPAYSSAKSGLAGLVTSTCGILGKDGIRVNSVLPGTTPTPATIKEWAYKPNHWDDILVGVPLNKLGTPEDVAETVFAVATQLTHISGTSLIVDGGQTVSR